MKKILFLLLTCITLASCGGAKGIKSPGAVKKSKSYKYDPLPKATRVADDALKYQGVKYKWGGTTSSGMDCSGLVYTAFEKEDVKLPRSSSAMAQKGRRIRVNEINVGDLVFFRTGKSRHKINHVGLVVELIPGTVNFIHSTTHGGVIVSSLNEKYWNKSFVEARRMFE